MKGESVCKEKKTLEAKDVNLDKLRQKRCRLKNECVVKWIGNRRSLSFYSPGVFTNAPGFKQTRRDSVLEWARDAVTTALRRRDRTR